MGLQALHGHWLATEHMVDEQAQARHERRSEHLVQGGWQTFHSEDCR
jgi:hypothetical protein